MKKKIDRLLILVILILLPAVSFGQKQECWIVNNAKNTFLQIGVLNPVDIGFQNKKRKFIGKNIYIKGGLMQFAKSLKSVPYYSDSAIFKKRTTLKRTNDNDISYRYPGAELTLYYDNLKPNGFIGQSFMKLLGNPNSALTYYKVIGNSPGNYSYYFCIIEKGKKAGLWIEPASLLLILDRVY